MPFGQRIGALDLPSRAPLRPLAVRSARLLLLVHTLLAGRSLADRALVIIPHRVVYDDNTVVIQTRASRVHEPGDEFGLTVGDRLETAVAADHQLSDGTVLANCLSRGQPASHGHPAVRGPLLPDDGITDSGPRNRLAAPTVTQNLATHGPILPQRCTALADRDVGTRPTSPCGLA